MAVTQKGVAVVWGVGEFTCTGVTTADLTQSIDFTYQSDTANLLDQLGESAGTAFYNLKGTVTISVIPSHATVEATAITQQDGMLAAPGTTVTLTADPKSTVAIGLNSGKYNLLQSRLRRANTGASIIEMDLETFVANDNTVAITES